MYLKSLVVFVLCTMFVLGFVVVLGFVTSGVGNTGQGTTTSSTTCPSQAASAAGFTITSPKLRTVNYTDELGIVNYATLSFEVSASSGSPLTSLLVCIGNSRAGSVSGPFNPGANRVVNLTLPATVQISPGKPYDLSVEGFYGSGSAGWETMKVTAQ